MSKVKKLIHDVETTHGATMDREGLINVFEYVEELEEANKTLSNNHFQQIEQHKRMAKQINRYKQTLEDFSDHGTRHDKTPTLVMDGNQVFKLLNYINSMDDYVRKKALQALKENPSEHVPRS